MAIAFKKEMDNMSDNLNANLKNATAQADQATDNAKTVWNVTWGWLTGHPVVLAIVFFVLGAIIL
jgi:hypothetical protein